MIEVALLDTVGPLGDIELQLGGTTPAAGRRRAGTFLVVVTVRHGEGARAIDVRFEDAGPKHLHEHVRYASGWQLAAPGAVWPYVEASLGALPGSAHVRELFARAGGVSPDDPASDAALDEPVPEGPHELRVFLRARPFPSSGLSEAEVEAFGIELPPALRAMARSSSIARARAAAAERAPREVAKLVGTPIEARVHRITDAVVHVLRWTGRRARADLVARWRALPLVAHPLALELVETAMLSGPAPLPDAAAVRARVRPTLAARFPDASTRRELLRIELGASVAATLEVCFLHRELRELLPPPHLIEEAALAAADAAIGEGGVLDPSRAIGPCVEILSSVAPRDAASRAAELASRSVAKLAEASRAEPVRAWVVGDLDEVLEPTYFTHAPPR